MLDDDNARVPFAVIGVLLILISTITVGYLMRMESAGQAIGISDDRDRDMSKALTLATADIGNALNYAGLHAQSEVGKSPIINISDRCPFPGGPEEVNDGRIKYDTFLQLSRYLEANYNGSFVYGDYGISASIIGDYRSLEITPDNMTLFRNFDHPVAGCERNYTAYYSMTAPVRLTVYKDGRAVYREDRPVKTLITSRYPLLEELTEEYGRRLNGTPMFIDLTAASFAYTWTRGYAQYAWGQPLNIVDNAHMALLVNGATLMEQGFEYNSVDPLSLAGLALKCFGSGYSPNEVTNYSVANSSKSDLPQNKTADPPRAYSFNASEMVDSAYDNVSFGGYAENTFNGAYSACMYLDIRRDNDYYPRVNMTGVFEDTPVYDLSTPSPGKQNILTRTFRVYKDNSRGNGYADRVTVTYILARYSALQYFGAGRYTGSSDGLGDPVLAGSSDDVASPFTPYFYEKDLSFGRKAFQDDNFRDVIKYYEASFDEQQNQGYFNSKLMAIVNDRDGWQINIPGPFQNRNYEFICGPDNRHPVWVEIESDYELRDLCDRIRKEVSVTLDPQDFGGSPASMSLAAYQELRGQFCQSYEGYLDQGSYSRGADNKLFYESCGSKAIFRVRQALLEDVRQQLDDAANRSGEKINQTIDKRMNGTGQNATDLTGNAAGAREYLGNNFYIPFGLAMTLNSSTDFAAGYPWYEQVTLAVDQQPSYLDTGVFTDPVTGYACRPLKLRNICLFAIPTDMMAGEVSDAMTARLLDGIDAMAVSVGQTANETVTAETNILVDSIATVTREKLKEEIGSAIENDPDMSGCISRETIGNAVDKAYARRNNDSCAIVHDLKDGTIAREVALDLAIGSSQMIKSKAQYLAGEYIDEYTAHFAMRIEEQVTRAEQKAIARTIDGLQSSIKSAVTDFAGAAAAKIAKDGSNVVLESALARVPSGLPLLPPYGWWATMNAWYIEVEGEIPVLTVYDADTEPVPDPVFGHHAIAYTRRYQVVRDEGGRTIGKNEPLRFDMKTSTFILVPPGAQGVGDKVGGWDEKSPGFDERGS